MRDPKVVLLLMVGVLLLTFIIVVGKKFISDIADIRDTGEPADEVLGDDASEDELMADKLAEQVAMGLSGKLTRSEIMSLKEYIVGSHKIDLIFLNYGRVDTTENGDVDVTSIYEQTIEQFNETDEMDERLYEHEGRWYLPREIVETSEEEDILVWYKGQGIFVSKSDLEDVEDDYEQVSYSLRDKVKIGGEYKYYYTGSDGTEIEIWLEPLEDGWYGLELEGVVFERTDDYKILE